MAPGTDAVAPEADVTVINSNAPNDVDRAVLEERTGRSEVPSIATPEEQSTRVGASQVQTIAEAPERDTDPKRVHIDLTTEEDEDIIVTNPEVTNAADTERRGRGSENIEDLHHELEIILRKKRVLELDAQEAEIRRKIAKRGGKASVKQLVKEEVKTEE